jgi:hypothetical protein
MPILTHQLELINLFPEMFPGFKLICFLVSGGYKRATAIGHKSLIIHKSVLFRNTWCPIWNSPIKFCHNKFCCFLRAFYKKPLHLGRNSWWRLSNEVSFSNSRCTCFWAIQGQSLSVKLCVDNLYCFVSLFQSLTLPLLVLFSYFGLSVDRNCEKSDDI